ncbi:MAG: hypothetical protein H6553_07085 [Chitinophagales bacterium]|nr:hypothetical protein [Chitinophagales bacterium]
MTLNLVTGISLISLFISFVALVISYLRYKREHKFENENFIYETKYDCYSKILEEISKLLRSIEDYPLKYKQYLSKINAKNLSEEYIDLLDDEIDNLSDSIDEIMYDFEELFIANSILIPKTIIDKLELFIGDIYDCQLPDSIDKEKEYKELLAKLDIQLTKLINQANQIDETIREDMNVESLNQSLYKRIRK